MLLVPLLFFMRAREGRKFNNTFFAFLLCGFAFFILQMCKLQVNAYIASVQSKELLKRQEASQQNKPPKKSFEPIRMPSGTSLVKIQGGSFIMGKDGAGGDGPTHRVKVSTFYMAQFEVANAQFDKFKKIKRHKYSLGDDQPVVTATFQDAVDYAAWLSKIDGVEYTLPTEAQWEYAARTGLEGFDYPWGNDIDESKAKIGGLETMPVGSYPPTKWGLYDIIGNVGEMTQDGYRKYSSAPRNDPSNRTHEELYVVRGRGINQYLPQLWMRADGLKNVVLGIDGFRLVCKSIPKR